jgi:fluoroquinolone transport system permease protein
MIGRILFQSFKADIKLVRRDPMLLMAMSAPFVIILLMKLIFPILSVIIYDNTGFNLDNYYTIVSLTILTVIPMLFGLVYAFILLDERDTNILQVISVTPAGKQNFLYMRMIVPVILSFILVLISIIITDPVPSEGWLRTVYVSFLFSTQAAFVFLFIGGLAANKIEGFALSKLYGIFIIAVPVGIILHHPWNYLAFFSPLYWISWAWITAIPSESFIFGLIAIFITMGSLILIFRHFLRKHSK